MNPKTFDVVLKFFIIGMGLWVIYMLVLKITGHSPSVDEITLALVSSGGIWFAKLNSSQSRLEGKFSEFKFRFSEYARNNDRRLDAVEKDLKAHWTK